MLQETAIIATTADLIKLVETAARASWVGVDVEGNGLFAYRASLCTVQLAWEHEGEIQIAVVDTLAVHPGPLGELLGARGPVKVLHDCTFDAKLLAETGVVLANVKDTSVLAKMLGRKATGLASLLASELGIVVTKELQQHDWSRRPLGARELEYLASDVRYLAALCTKLTLDAQALDIEEEIVDECAFKLESAMAPPRERGPAYLRIKGAEALDPLGLAVLRRLVEERERIAASWDVPPFKVVGNDLLLVLARSKPTTLIDLHQLRRGLSPRLLGMGDRLVSAIVAGIGDSEVPPADKQNGPRPDRAVLALRRAREKRLSGWRRKEAAARGVDEQVVLPGHCLQELVGLDEPRFDAITQVPGLGQKRGARYAAILQDLLATPTEPESLAITADPEP